jgi:hypothetical protein
LGLLSPPAHFFSRRRASLLTCMLQTPGGASIRRPLSSAAASTSPGCRERLAGEAGRRFRWGIRRGRHRRPASPSSWRCSSSPRPCQLVRPVASPARTRDLICSFCFIWFALLEMRRGSVFFSKFACMALDILVAFQWILAGVCLVTRIV